MSGGVEEPNTAVIPTKEQIKLLPPFAPLGLDRITLVSSASDAEQTCAELVGVDVCGFDTESKALFKRGEVSDGPHLVQLATVDKAWVIQMHDSNCRATILQWLGRSNVTKAGFGLHHDRRQIAPLCPDACAWAKGATNRLSVDVLVTVP